MRELTREEILAMEPGRKLDAIVAEKVMGYHGIFTVTDRLFYNDSIKEVVPWFSTDMAAAWEVLDKFRDRCDWYGVDTFRNGYRCIILDKRDRIGEAYGDTAPEVIVKAALLAVLEATP